ncbi:MAG: hypothetical protein ACN4GK_07710 [Acidimicrobiia bacterium]
MGREHDVLTSLRRVNDGLAAVVQSTTQTVVQKSADPGSMEIAFAAIAGTASGDEGREALRMALIAEGMDQGVIDSIDALYVRCLLDPTL